MRGRRWIRAALLLAGICLWGRPARAELSSEEYPGRTEAAAAGEAGGQASAEESAEPREDSAAEVNTEIETLPEGQRKARIYVVSIIGNELTYYEESGEKGQPDQRSSDYGEANAADRKRSEDSGEVNDAGRERSEDSPEFRGGHEESESADRKRGAGGGPSGRGSRNTSTVYLPVAIVVHTDLDEPMTFSILRAGDTLEALFEETENGEIIVELWMQSETEAAP